MGIDIYLEMKYIGKYNYNPTFIQFKRFNT